MSTELESLPDDKLSEVFAVEVAEMDLSFNCDPDNECYTECAINHSERLENAHVFSKSADAVLPYLAECFLWRGSGCNGKSCCELATESWWINHASRLEDGDDLEFFCQSESFARSACTVLIQYKRAEKGAK